MSLRQKALKGVVWSAIQNFGTRGISFITFLVLARLLEPKAFGLVAFAAVFTSLMRVFLDQGFGSAIVQRQDLHPLHLDTAFWTNVASGLLLTAFGISVAGPVADLFEQQELGSIIRWFSLAFLLTALSQVQIAILRRKLAFKTLAARSLIAEPIGGVAGVVMALLGFGVWSLVGRQLICDFFQVLVLWRASEWRPRAKFSTRHFKDLFSFGISMMGTNMVHFFSRKSDHFLIGYVLGPVALGYYTVAYRLLITMTESLGGTIESVAWPVFSRLQKEWEKMRQVFYTTTKLTSLIAFPAFLGVFAVVPELVPTLFGEKWVPSVPVMQVLCFIGLMHSLMYFNETIIVSVGKPAWRLGLHALVAVGNVIGFLIAVRWGIVAVAISYVIVGYLLFAPLSLWMAHRLIKIDLPAYFGQYLGPVVGSMVMLVVIFALKLVLGESVGLLPQIIIYVLSGAAAYVLTVLLLFPSLIRQLLDLVRSLRQETAH